MRAQREEHSLSEPAGGSGLLRQALHQAYLQGVRDYNDVLKDGRIAGPNAEDVVDAIARYSVTKDRDRSDP